MIKEGLLNPADLDNSFIQPKTESDLKPSTVTDIVAENAGAEESKMSAPEVSTSTPQPADIVDLTGKGTSILIVCNMLSVLSLSC